MFHYAFSRKLPVQIIITRGKELIMSEKKMRAGYGAKLVTQFSPMIESKDFTEFEAFVREVSGTRISLEMH